MPSPHVPGTQGDLVERVEPEAEVVLRPGSAPQIHQHEWIVVGVDRDHDAPPPSGRQGNPRYRHSAAASTTGAGAAVLSRLLRRTPRYSATPSLRRVPTSGAPVPRSLTR